MCSEYKDYIRSMFDQPTITVKYFWVFIALYMLNICVDSPDILQQLPENLKYNDQESIIELIVEKVIGIENAIPEQDDNDTEEYKNLENNLKLDQFTAESFKTNALQYRVIKTQDHTNWIRNLYPSGFIEIVAPPPKFKFV